MALWVLVQRWRSRTTVGDGKGLGIAVTVDSSGAEVDGVAVAWGIVVGAGVAVGREVT